jgi:predicted phage baseplate assembly protein
VPLPDVSRRALPHPRDVDRLPAARLQDTNPEDAVGEVWLVDGRGRAWTARSDLLRSTPYSRDFVVEADEGGASRLRFGDGTLGMRPPPGTVFTLVCRTGVGASGNVGREVLASLEAPADEAVAARMKAGITQVRNPLPAWGGADPEPLRVVRAQAPRAYQVQERGVTPDDWKELAGRAPQVRRAEAEAGWSGTTPQDRVWVQRVGGFPEDPEFLRDVRLALEPARLAGRALRVLPPVYVGVEVALEVWLDPGTLQSAALQALNAALGPGAGGVFSPAGLTFGQPVWLSVVIAAAAAVTGVTRVQAVRFARWSPYGGPARVADELPMAVHEIARMLDDPAAPWNGTLTLSLRGGIG